MFLGPGGTFLPIEVNPIDRDRPRLCLDQRRWQLDLEVATFIG